MQSKARLILKRRAVLARINRHLAKDDRVVKSTRGAPEADWMEVDTSQNQLVGWIKNLEAYGRELGVIAPYEQMEK